jgi:hypothetical protein
MENNNIKKNKFVENLGNEYNKQPYYEIKNENNINEILYDTYNKKNKNTNQDFFYYSPFYNGPGRGFGNLNINNTIRNGEFSRGSNEDFKINREAKMLDRFDYIDNRYANPSNLVLPFPRTGNTSRDNEDKLNVNINDYNFNNPYILQSFQKLNAEIDKNNNNPTNLPNKYIVEEINEKNELQRQIQLEYLKKKDMLNNRINILENRKKKK